MHMHLHLETLVVNGFPELIVGDEESGRHKQLHMHLHPDSLMVTSLLAQVEEGPAAVTQSKADCVNSHFHITEKHIMSVPLTAQIMARPGVLMA